MNKETLVKRLQELKQISDATIVEINQHENVVTSLREKALNIQGRYAETEELLKNLETEIIPPKKEVK